MKLLRGKRGGLIAFLVIAALVMGGLAWVTKAVLDLEHREHLAGAQAELAARLRLALWRLDSRVFAELAREASRPYQDYNAIYPPSNAFRNDGQPWPPGAVLEPSPLLSQELPAWMPLHFQASKEGELTSPQVLSAQLRQRLTQAAPNTTLENVTPQRAQLLEMTRKELGLAAMLAAIEQQEKYLASQRTTPPLVESKSLVLTAPGLSNLGANNTIPFQQGANSMAPGQGGQLPLPPPDPEFNRRNEQRQVQTKGSQQRVYQDEQPLKNFKDNGEQWLTAGAGAQAPGGGGKRAQSRYVSVRAGPMVPFWQQTPSGERLIIARRVDSDDARVCQGIVIDWEQLRQELTAEVEDLFPAASLVPMRESIPTRPERTMTALPVELHPGIVPTEPLSGWTPLRFGLLLAWLAALLALAAVGLGGWSLIDLSERRIGFVSAVTHELRTPLTTLRLYLDMMTSGMVRDEAQKAEYLATLNVEADRLHRLVGNVLDFSRLENQRTRPEKTTVEAAQLLEQIRVTWEDRCRSAGKTLVVDYQLPEGHTFLTDTGLVQQILGNLIDNACKYSRHAADQRIWLRALLAEGHLRLEVEDHGPGVSGADARVIFKPFRRGRRIETAAGGVGLGLALAQRWAGLLGGDLTLAGRPGPGACFVLRLPAP